ncbi:uncharacterized protein LOC132737068 [Ruditapes philippinarum]|uniref:uncharacterized protein LOC132737068 n=1 Tax=Ruditapes philippinarum TaxID=129788 RepID=UPI00295B5554|nr:uncharacterized protein LOC132737068 [Ruditapes philippinarum]
MKLVVIAVILLLLEQIVAKKCSEAPGVDGCSIPDWIPNKNKFKPACYKHDVCYACGTALDVNRITCDRRFLFNCYERCGDKTNCRRVAGWYYKAVRWFGAFAYQTVSPEWCTEDWVSECML